MLQLTMDFVLLLMLKNVLIYLSVDIENELMIIAIVHRYLYCLVSIAAYNDVQHFHNQLLDIHDGLIPKDLNIFVRIQRNNILVMHLEKKFIIDSIKW